MRERSRHLLAAGVVVVAFVLVQLGGLLLADTLATGALGEGADPDDPRLGVAFVIGLLIATGVVYASFRFGRDWIVRALVFLVTAGVTAFVFGAALPVGLPVAGMDLLAVAAAVLVTSAAFRYPRWWVVDAQGVLVGIGIVALFGRTFAVRPVIVMLAVLALYDAISVYGTRHMLGMARGAVESRLPVLLIVPLSGSWDEGETGDDSPWGDAIFIGLGDAAIPAILVVSAHVYGTAGAAVVGLSVPVIGTMVGIVVGLVGLLWITAHGRAHAGLPLLNAGAIGGYLLGGVLVGIDPLSALGV